MKKRISLFLVFAMLVTLLVPLAVTTVSADDPTLITDQASFVSAIATNSVKDSDGKATGSFKLANDITISGTWNFTTAFRGELDGDGHTITFADGAVINGGLFQVVGANAYIHDLQIAQAGSATWTLQTGLSGSVNACLGGVVGLSGAGVVNGANSWGNESFVSGSANKVRIENVTVTINMDVTGSAVNASVGGIVGEVGIYTEVTNCAFNGYISDATNRYVNGNTDSYSNQNSTVRSAYGGMVGFCFRRSVVVISECINNGNITGYGQEGGILGIVSPAWNGNDAFNATTIQRCINTGTITCLATTSTCNVGGIAGFIFVKNGASATVRSCINRGALAKADGDAHVTGIVGALRRGADNAFQLIGNLQDSNVNPGSQIAQALEGSGAVLCENNFSVGGSTGSMYTTVADAEAYAAAYVTLNAAYPDVYVYLNDQISLAWAESGAVVGEYVMITNQASFVSAIATNSVKDADGKATGKFKLAADITISGDWNFTTIFRGELDGDGHTITFADGATITGGLFTMVSANAYIHDLSIAQEGSATWILQTGDGKVNYFLGGVAGFAGAGVVNGANSWGNESYVSSEANKVRFENVTVTLNMDVTGNTPNASVGGIVGEIGLYTEITNCVFNGYISDATERTGNDSTSSQDGDAHNGGTKRSAYGGIAGFGYREAVVVITECINNGNITGYGQEGGIFGAVSPAWGSSGTFKSTTIQRCINNGTITCNLTTAAGGVGGISAYLYGRRKNNTTVNVLNNINNGTVAKAEGGAFIAGIVACVNSKAVNNVITFAGNLQLSDNIGGGSQIMDHADGDGESVLIYSNNFGCGAGNSAYSPLTYTKNYVDAYIALNAAYADTYVFRNNKVTLKWADDAVFHTVTSVIGAQLSTVAGETRSIRMVAGTTDDLTVDTVGIEVTVYYGSEGASRGFTGDTDTVYTSVYAAGVPVTAASQGVDYLYTGTLDNVPMSIGVVTLLIRTFHEKDSETYYGDYTAMTLDLAS